VIGWGRFSVGIDAGCCLPKDGPLYRLSGVTVGGPGEPSKIALHLDLRKGLFLLADR